MSEDQTGRLTAQDEQEIPAFERRNGTYVDGASRLHVSRPAASPRSDYPVPTVVSDEDELVWNEDEAPVDNYRALGQRLAAVGDLYRRPAYAGGLLLVPKGGAATVAIESGRRLSAIIADRVRVRVVKSGNTRSNSVPGSHPDTMLRCETFLQQFRPVDDVVTVAHYLPDFTLLEPGYNDGGPGMRFLYLGPKPSVESSQGAITQFLDVMAFASNADRTNAVAAALTVMLRHFWPGARPLIAVTSTKSHGGKDTVIQFAAGSTPKLSVSYESTDWAFQKSFVALVKHSRNVGVVNVENVRLGKGTRFIASTFLERFLHDPEPDLYSPGTGAPERVRNQTVVTLSANLGTISEDLLNRALPIHLNPVGNVADRVSPIGNPKLDFLPAQRDRIEAELRGMIENWKAADRPLDNDVRHPFSEWSRTIGGILRVNGFTDFLGNYSLRRTADDPLRHGLGLLGAARPDVWLRPHDWARLAVDVGVAKSVIPEHDRDSDKSRARGIGVVLSAHCDETFEVEMEDETLTLSLEKTRRRFDGNGPSTRYRFVVLSRTPVPEDPTPPA